MRPRDDCTWQRTPVVCVPVPMQTEWAAREVAASDAAPPAVSDAGARKSTKRGASDAEDCEDMDMEGDAVPKILEGLKQDLAAAGLAPDAVKGALDGANEGMVGLHEATRRTPYDVGLFTVKLAPLLAACPKANDVTADALCPVATAIFALCCSCRSFARFPKSGTSSVNMSKSAESRQNNNERSFACMLAVLGCLVNSANPPK